MTDDAVIEQLEELAKSFGIQIRSEAIKQDEDLVRVVGGLCKLKGEYVLIINSKATKMDRVWTLATALKHFDVESIYLRPVIRELLDKVPEQEQFSPKKESL